MRSRAEAFHQIKRARSSIVATTWGDTLSILRRPDGVVLASEPYDDDPDWQEVPDRHLVAVEFAEVTLTPLKGRS